MKEPYSDYKEIEVDVSKDSMLKKAAKMIGNVSKSSMAYNTKTPKRKSDDEDSDTGYLVYGKDELRKKKSSKAKPKRKRCKCK